MLVRGRTAIGIRRTEFQPVRQLPELPNSTNLNLTRRNRTDFVFPSQLGRRCNRLHENGILLEPTSSHLRIVI